MGNLKLLISDLAAVLNKAVLSTRLNLEWYNHLKTEGFCIINNYVSSDVANALSERVKANFAAYSDSIISYDHGTDIRLFGIERVDKSFEFFSNNPPVDRMYHAVQGYPKINNKVLMANIVTARANNHNNLGSGGGWHRDSPYTNQFKSFLFLKDVEIENGPLTYIKGTHTRESIHRFCKATGLPSSQYRFTDTEIEKVTKMLGLSEVKVTCKAGTMLLANTRGLHRGAPIMSGERVAITSYYFGNKLPEGINLLSGVAGV
ncbi:phytanoyl-CoA dioxygenase family protein [Planctobacterium marinum]|uniref:phytanoyl-CoA dioxygenase family protein n=1 Tax=Planctobacterium marinum TaxID=1631968 RepID=UPI001E35E23C|nr:phytanoyl-CoA dioxygenase family protein [Planctobacterium marinum]MCC2606143.1 phytanoyl-CoA dioxygenase family protein [Planctobacterium marinum]